MKRLGMAVAVTMAMISAALANEPEEITFEILRHNCTEISAINDTFCEAYLLGVLGQLSLDEKCNVGPELLSLNRGQNGLNFMAMESEIRKASVYDYPKEARLAVNKIARGLFCS